jgi:cytochrome c5
LPGNHALEQLSGKKNTELEMVGERSFGRVCSQCHTLPNPKLHTASDWPRIVERMRENMFRMLKPVPDDVTTQAIVAFLSANAS